VLAGDDATEVARKIKLALANDADIGVWFYVRSVGATVILTCEVQANNDSTINVAIANGTCAGLTEAPTSANTTSGGGSALVVLTRRIQDAANDATLLITIAKAAVGGAVGPSDVTSVNTTAGVIGDYAALEAVLPSFAADAVRQGGRCFMPWAFNGGAMDVAAYYPVLTAGPSLEWERDWAP